VAALAQGARVGGMSDSGAADLWSSEQRSWLQALGHTVFVDRNAPIEALAEAPASEERDAAASVRPQAPAAPPSPSRRAPPSPPDAADAGPAASAVAPPRRGRVGLPDRLQLALLRASGLNPSDPATQALMETWPLAELRANPRAKRALWPQLRALRRKGARP